jgi:hypothetical protein
MEIKYVAFIVVWLLIGFFAGIKFFADVKPSIKRGQTSKPTILEAVLIMLLCCLMGPIIYYMLIKGEH